MIVVTGAAGFIGSCLIGKLNKEGYKAIIAVDYFSSQVKNLNLAKKELYGKVHRDEFEKWLSKNQKEVEFIFHLGARTDTSEFDRKLLSRLNTEYSKMIWNSCVDYQIPLLYASSAATYGLGEYGYEDDESSIGQLKPLNPYGDSKNEFDVWTLEQERKPFYFAGLKFFNVYGPNEYHKGRMASVILHAYRQINETGGMKLFRSHNPEYKDGEQMRDFIYVKDVCDICFWLMHHRKDSGIYNIGTGEARTFRDLTHSVFASLDRPDSIDFVDTPKDIRDKYQYFTEATMNKLRDIGYSKPFHSLEEGIQEYVHDYLRGNLYY